VRDTKRGQEEITREIPNVAEEGLVSLDDRGIVRVGAAIKPGDILVGKVSPKGEKELSPEERLLTAIFGEKAKDVKDTSLKAPPGMEGVVIDVKVFSRQHSDPLTMRDKELEADKARRYEEREVRKVLSARNEALGRIAVGQAVRTFSDRKTRKALVEPGAKVQAADVAELEWARVNFETLQFEGARANDRVRAAMAAAEEKIEELQAATKERLVKIGQPDDLPPGVVQLVKVYIAQKRKLSVGDKMAGRHGNKGIVARIAGRDLSEPAGRPLADERRADPRDPPGVGREAARAPRRHAGVPRRDRGGDPGDAGEGGAAAERAGAAPRRQDRRRIRARGHGGLHLHAQALPPRG
jgi:DNA-directed RNA polymerase subunit beta